MTIFSLVNIGSFIIDMVEKMRPIVQNAIGLTVAVVVAFLLVRILTDVLKLNPFGRIYQNARRPSDEMIYRMRSSPFYHPLKRAFGFDPSIIMVMIALAIVWYVVYVVINNLFFILQNFGSSLILFGNGLVLSGASRLIGTLLLGAIFFLMALMTIVFVNWIFGLLQRAALWSMGRLAPLLRVFDFGGAFAGWSFVILWIALYFAAIAVTTIFF